MKRKFNRKAVEKVLTDCGWKIDPLISTCFGGITYGADGKYPDGAVFQHPIHDTIFIMVKGETDPDLSRTRNRWEIIAGSKFKGWKPMADPLAYGYTAASLTEKLLPQIAIPRSRKHRS